MTAYIIAEVNVTDPDKFEKYRAQVPDVIRQYNGKYIVRGGRTEKLEGDAPIHRMVMLEFTDMDSAKAFWHSAEYAPLKALRQEASDSEIMIVEGL
ncbi:MAG: D-fructose-6-phosphate amidotransferase [Rhodospirillaceae bacterium]|nr:D-fructose-6-phosphate amidotransferase [Rhodospirillaceae bacterium]